MSRPVRGLVLAHSSLAFGLAAAVRQISGADEEALEAVSNDGQGPDGMVEAIEKRVGDQPTIIFTDLTSGSCAFAARKFARARPEIGIVCGVNLPILIDFVFHREMPLGELVARLVEKGRGGINGTCVQEAADADRAAPR
jgi:mannose/fructose-specific phosphotransferase system component IIA